MKLPTSISIRPFLMLLLSISALVVSNSRQVNAQVKSDSDSLQYLYETLRTRLKNEFVFVGNGPGLSIAPANKTYFSNKKVQVKYADNITYHGWYLSTLATEYALLKRDGKPTGETLKELFYAIQVVHRLDSIAETFYYDSLGRRGNAEINGFFVRDDIDTTFKSKFKNVNRIDSDYLLGESFGKDHPKYQRDNEMSQDQAIHLLFGLTLVTHYVDSAAEYQGIKVAAFAREIGLRIIRYIAADKWMIYNPVTGLPVYRGPDARLFSYGFRKTAKKLNGGKMPDKLPPAAFFSKPASGIMTSGLTPVFFNRTMIMILATTGNTWGPKQITNRFLAAQDIMWKKEVFPLAHAELYGVKHTFSPRLREKKIKSMLLHMNPDSLSSDGPGGWNNSNRWLESHKKYKPHGPANRRSEFPGLDYMTLHNLYRLRFKK
ncbi:MAG: hypothetical protein MH137_11670 [Flavobacteriales bacterium]|nr:hypothetical protein [Flavobacteriales bacterium]